jgi:hypothetical protein
MSVSHRGVVHCYYCKTYGDHATKDCHHHKPLQGESMSLVFHEIPSPAELRTIARGLAERGIGPASPYPVTTVDEAVLLNREACKRYPDNIGHRVIFQEGARFALGLRTVDAARTRGMLERWA